MNTSYLDFSLKTVVSVALPTP